MKKKLPINVAVIGCGALAQQMHIPNVLNSSRMVLHTCCDLNSNSLAECEQKFHPLHITSDYEATIHDPEVDLIVLATTEKFRLEPIRLAAAAGKPMYVEKPIATSLQVTYEIQQIVNDSGIPFCVGHNRRSSPAMIDANRIFRAHMENPIPCVWRWNREQDLRVAQPEDGVASMSVRINDDWYSWKAWVFDPTQAPHGPMLFEMTHFTDMCNWMLGSQPVAVTAVETGMLNHAIIIRYAGGELATLNMTGNGTFGYPKELFEMMGNGALVAVDHMVEVRTAGIADASTKIPYPLINDRFPDVGTKGGISGFYAKQRAACEQASSERDSTLVIHGNPNKGHAAQLERFVDQIQGVGPVVCSIDDAVLATRVAFAAIRSAHEKRTVGLEEV